MDKLAVVDPFVVVNCLLSYSKRTKAARKFRFWNTQFSALRVPRSIESHQVNTTCLIISVLWLLSPELVYRVNFYFYDTAQKSALVICRRSKQHPHYKRARETATLIFLILSYHSKSLLNHKMNSGIVNNFQTRFTILLTWQLWLKGQILKNISYSAKKTAKGLLLNVMTVSFNLGAFYANEEIYFAQ